MKNLCVVAAALAFSFAAQAKTVETIVTCQQDDGDNWVEVGIGLNDGPGVVAYVVQHSDDDSSKLVYTGRVTGKRVGFDTVYMDEADTFKLFVRREEGFLTVLFDGPGSINQSDMVCIYNSEIELPR